VAGTTDDALARFDAGAPVDPAAMTGRWRGSGLPTGHPLDGLLERFGWWGKEVLDPETVHPLLFGRPDPVPLQPALAPLGLLRRAPGLARAPGAPAVFAALRPLLRTRQPAARLRLVEHRGVLTAALVYDRLPVVDVLRRLSEDRLIGLMDLRGMPRPFFFLLDRDPG
jgi:hypothetical protein